MSDENKVILLAPYLVRHHWEKISSMLKSADDTTMSIDDIEDQIEDGTHNYDIWIYVVGGEMKYVLLAERLNETYFILRTAGSGKHFPWPELVAHMKQRAAGLSCTELSFIGEKVWEEKVKDLGFEVVQYYYSAPIDVSADIAVEKE